MRAVLRTIAQCHAHRILHRDIKPGNFMLLSDREDAPVKAIGGLGGGGVGGVSRGGFQVWARPGDVAGNIQPQYHPVLLHTDVQLCIHASTWVCTRICECMYVHPLSHQTSGRRCLPPVDTGIRFSTSCMCVSPSLPPTSPRPPFPSSLSPDFGLAVFYDPKKLPLGDLGLEGTPWYMAPEVREGYRRVGRGWAGAGQEGQGGGWEGLGGWHVSVGVLLSCHAYMKAQGLNRPPQHLQKYVPKSGTQQPPLPP
jgi:serine/threonine protein kinase